MKILITGANGFIGRNLKAELFNNKYKDLEPLYFDRDTDPNLLETYCSECDFVVHLAGINRPQNEEEFMEGNFGFTSTLLNTLKKYKNRCPILVTSSIQAVLDNPYGKSKKAGEDLIFEYGKEENVKVDVYRLPNVFGKWGRPNYNSAICTFAHNIANDLPIQVNDRNHSMTIVYIDDVVKEIMRAIYGKENRKDDQYCYVEPVIKTTLGEIADILYSFKNYRDGLKVPNNNSLLERDLYATYLSYIPATKMSYPLNKHEDARGSFTEIIRTVGQGQFSVNITHPGITKGNHFHHTKHEKYLVVAGKASIQLRKVATDEIIEYIVSGDNLEVVDIPVGYTHSIKNIGTDELITFMWANEPFDPENPDTIAMEVNKNE
ncbi:MAG: NAD-dependent epimerase/dehydratase family protein [Erysipelotrichales bacterium]|nr:NAD-dependent epimerase/dehydratase family protein [Erysipelotrichales bacterium]